MKRNNTPEFLALQQLWYDKLKEDGFVDIESGQDTNLLNTSTLPVARVQPFDEGTEDDGQPIDFLEMASRCSTKIFGSQVSIWDTPQAVGWRELTHAATDLPKNYHHRRFIAAVCEQGCFSDELLTEHNLTYQEARTVFAEFLKRAGLFETHRYLRNGGPVKSNGTDKPSKVRRKRT